MQSINSLRAIKAAHSLIWAFFASCIIAIPVASWSGKHELALWLVAIVFIEVLVLLFNQLSCPLTAIAAKHTLDRSENFDIYLPRLLAKYNKQVFGTLYVSAAIYAVVAWAQATSS